MARNGTKPELVARQYSLSPVKVCLYRDIYTIIKLSIYVPGF